MSVMNHKSTLRKTPKGRRPHLHRGERKHSTQKLNTVDMDVHFICQAGLCEQGPLGYSETFSIPTEYFTHGAV